MGELIKYTVDDIENMAGNADHNRVSSLLGGLLNSMNLGRKKCYAGVEGTNYYPSKTLNKFYVPDVIIICKGMEKFKGGVAGNCSFIAEVLSNSTKKIDIVEKKYYYALGGVQEYWIIDIYLKSVTVNILSGKTYIATDYIYDGIHDIVLTLHCWPEVRVPLSWIFMSILD